MAAQRKPVDPGYDSDLGTMWVMIGALCALALLQYMYGDFFKAGWLKWKSVECSVLMSIPLFSDDIQKEALAIKRFIDGRSAEQVSFEQYDYIRTTVYGSMRWVYVAMVVAMLPLLLFVRQKKTERLTARSLMKQEAALYPWLKQFIKIDMFKQSMIKGPHAARKHPHEFAEEHKLVRNGRLDRQRTELALAAQLGRRWTGHGNLKRHERWALAIVLTRLDRDDDMFDKLVTHTNNAMVGEESPAAADALATTAMSLLDRPDFAPIVARHAYFRTLVAEISEALGQRGTFSSAVLRWLKPIDRTLWYVINDAGHNAGVETIGVRCHYQHEVVLNRAVTLPIVNSAVTDLEDILWRMGRLEMPQRVRDEENERRALQQQLLDIEARRAAPPPGR